MSINVSGLIQNLLSEGFDLRDCLGELFDNSLDAGATKIGLSLVGGWLYFADNGSGMTADGLVLANELHRRSTGRRNGRFGIGSAAAKICLSKHMGSSKVLTRCATGLSLSTVNWAECVRANMYRASYAGATTEALELWALYGLGSTGTVVGIECAPTIYAELERQVGSDEAEHSLAAWIGRVYNVPIREGLQVQIGGVERIVGAQDPLEWSDTQGERQHMVSLDIWAKGTEVRAYMQGAGRRGDFYYEFVAGRKAPKSIYNGSAWAAEDGWENVGQMSLRSSHRKLWETGPTWLQGVHLVRGAKIVDRVPPPKGEMRGQDARRYKAVSRHTLQWNPNADFDRLMGVQINKSHIKPDDINEAILKTVKHLCDEFAKCMNKLDTAAEAARKAAADAAAAAEGGATAEATAEEEEEEDVAAGAIHLDMVDGGIQVSGGPEGPLVLTLGTLEQLQMRLDAYGPERFLTYARAQLELDALYAP
jgi:hypothetical protein